MKFKYLMRFVAYKIFFMFLLFSSSLFAFDENEQIEVRLFYALEPLNLGQVQEFGHWRGLESLSYSLGYQNAPIWIRAQINNPTKNQLERYIQLSEAFFQKVSFYHSDTRSLKAIEALEATRPTFKVDIKPYATTDVYFYIESDFAHYAMVSLYTQREFEQKKLLYNSFFMLYFGAVIIMLLYNIFLYLILRDRGYLFYVGYVSSFAAWVFLYSGYALYFIDNGLYYSLHFVTPLAFVFFILFSRYILQTKKNLPKIDLFLRILGSLVFAIAIVIFFDIRSGFLAANLFAFILFPALLLTAFLSLNQTPFLARFYLFGLLLFIASMALLSVVAWGIVDVSIYSKYAFILASLVEITLFSFMLAYRVHQIKTEQLEIQNELIALKKNETKRLETLVHKKTLDLENTNTKLKKTLQEKESLLKEVHHRVKNNLQSVIALLWLQTKHMKQIPMKQTLDEISLRIHSIALVHELLYSSQDVKQIDLAEFFDKLLSALARLHTRESLRVDKEIASIKISMDSAISLGMIAVELISNSIKHAKPKDEKLHIKLEILSENGTLFVNIKDNGEEFLNNELNNESTLGVTLIKQMSKKLPNAKFAFLGSKAMEFHLEFMNEYGE